MAESALSTLVKHIGLLHERTQQAAAQQVNCWLTVRNWLIGWYIAEYEQHGDDRATYGEQLMPELARRLREVPGLAVRRLYQCREFYQAYPTILQTVSAKLKQLDLPNLTASDGFAKPGEGPITNNLPGIAPDLLLSRLSFSHFIELLLLDAPLQRAFYEVQAVQNSWSVRELKRAVGSALYERTGLSTDKAAVLAGHAGNAAAGGGRCSKEPLRTGVSGAGRTGQLQRKRPGIGHHRPLTDVSGGDGARLLL